jgi:general secretion pathway protein C
MGWMAELKSTEGLQAALSEHGPRLAAATLVALIAIQAGFLVTSQNRGAPTGTSGSAAGAAASAWASGSAQAPPLQISSIVAAHLFGEPHGTVTDANAPQTSVQLVLAGVLALPDPKRGLAIIGPNPGAAKLYTVGSALPGGVNLYAVYPDRVLIDRGGVIESLLLPKKLLPGSTAPVAAAPGQSPAQRLAALAQGNSGLLGGLVRAQAVFAGGKLAGYRIFPGGRASVGSFTQLGLRPGDLVTAVNGTALDDPNRANEILQTLSSAASASLTVQRNGQSMDLNLNLETVVSDAENAATQAAAAARRGGAFGGPLGGNRFPGVVGGVPAPGPADEANATPPADEPPERAPSDQ